MNIRPEVDSLLRARARGQYRLAKYNSPASPTAPIKATIFWSLLVPWYIRGNPPLQYVTAEEKIADMPDDEFEALVARYKLETSE